MLAFYEASYLQVEALVAHSIRVPVTSMNGVKSVNV